MTATTQTHPFVSILGRSSGLGTRAPVSEGTVHDLALSRIVDPLVTSAPYARAAFLTPLATSEEVYYRHEVFRCLESSPLMQALRSFHDALVATHTRRRAASASHDTYQGARIRLEALLHYADAVEAFTTELPRLLDSQPEASIAFEEFADYLLRYVAAPTFADPVLHARELVTQLNALRYSLLLRGGQVLVSADPGDDDLSAAVESTFSRFRQDGPTSTVGTQTGTLFDHVQGWIIEKVAELNPHLFDELVTFTSATADMEDAALHRFEQEMPFYFAFREYSAPLIDSGLPLAYPIVSADDKTLRATDGWDMALASAALDRGTGVVTNDLELTGPERILVVSGPNQGGKTTTARLFGQLYHLASIGCPVPARDATVFLCDHVLTLFDREEDGTSEEGRLGAEVDRLRDVLAVATPASVIVLNELFASTSLLDARILTRDALERISALDCPTICVTFIDELSRLNYKTVSMVSVVDADDPAKRTYRVERRPADGLAYAAALARKHGLTAELIDQRLTKEGSQ